MQDIIGYVIVDAEGNTLSKESLWLIVRPEMAFVHAPESIDVLRENFSKHRNRPQLMYPVVMEGGAQIVQTANPITFTYATSHDKRPFFGDCAQLLETS